VKREYKGNQDGSPTECSKRDDRRDRANVDSALQRRVYKRWT